MKSEFRMQVVKAILLFSLIALTSFTSCTPFISSALSTGRISSPANISQEFSLPLQALVFSVMLFGLFSLVIQIIPGLTIIWLAALVYGVVTGFTWVSIIIFIFMTGLMIFGNFMDEILMSRGAHKSGASWLTILVAILAGVWGSLQFPPFGGLIAALLALFILEALRLKDWRKALASTREMALGCGYAFFARFGIGILLILLWIVWVWSVQ